MTEKELRRLGRGELVEIIAAQKRTELELRSQLAAAEKQITSRTIQIANAGSIAEAALSLSGIFEAAQTAADTYLQSVQAAAADIDGRLAQAREERERILQSAQQEAQARIQAAEKECAEKLAAADREIEKKWSEFQGSVDRVLQSRSELSSFLHSKQNG